MLCFPMLLCGFSASSVLLSSAPASNIFPMALRHGAPASNKPHLAEKKYFGLASNLAHLGRIC